MRNFGLNVLVLHLRATHFLRKWKELGVVVTFILKIATTVEVSFIPLRRTLFMSHFENDINAEVANIQTLTALYIFNCAHKKFCEKKDTKHNKCISKGVICDRTWCFYLSEKKSQVSLIVSGPFCSLARLQWYSIYTVFWGYICWKTSIFSFLKINFFSF